MKGFRTVGFNLLMGALSAAYIYVGGDAQISEAEVAEQADQIWTGIVAVWTIGNLVIRKYTNTDIFRGE